MELIRQAIEQRLRGVTGTNELNLDRPHGDPGLFGPGSMAWRVHGDFTAMMIGGVSALLLQMLHPAALAGVWDHSNFRADMAGRLRRTAQFISGTTYGSAEQAARLIARVRAVHDHVHGSLPDGTPYSANDPALLNWVHVAETSSFLQAHLRYREPWLSLADQDRYFSEMAIIAERLGAQAVPRSRAQVLAYLHAVRPALHCDDRTREIAGIILSQPAPRALAAPARAIVMDCAVDLLPRWALDMHGLRIAGPRRYAARAAGHGIGAVARWAMRNGSARRAGRRMAVSTGNG